MLNILLSVRHTSRETIYCIGKSVTVIYAPFRPQDFLPTFLVVFREGGVTLGFWREAYARALPLWLQLILGK